MMMTSILLIGVLVTSSAFGTKDEGSKPRMASLEIEPNFEYGLTSKEFRVHYSGVGQTFAHAESVSIKIYNNEDLTAPVITFSVPQEEKDTPKAYFFALQSATSGKYSVEVCADGICSEKNPSLTAIPTNKQLTCRKGRDNAQGQFEFDGSDSSELSVEIIGAGTFIDASEASNIDSAITRAVQEADPNAPAYQTEWTKLGASRNPEYFRGTQTFYAGVMYNIRHFKAFFEGTKTKSTQQGEIYTPEICERKYILTMNVHLFNEGTKQVQHRFKTALHLSNSVKYGYILNAAAGPIHVEMKKTQVNIAAGTYKVWISFCATEKDKVESTICSDPVTSELVVTATA